jgi:hypothetical protein
MKRAAVLDGIPGYRIKTVAPDGSMAPAPEKSEYLPVLYTATEPPDSPIYGLDLRDGGVRQKTLEHASDGNTIATSAQRCEHASHESRAVRSCVQADKSGRPVRV